jgi:hypothetical protein
MALEWEEEIEYPTSGEMWADINMIAAANTDLVVLNNAPATVAYAVLDENKPVIVKNQSLYWCFFLTVSSAAQDFREFAREYWEIKQRA